MMKWSFKKNKPIVNILISIESIIFYYILLYPFLGENRVILTLNLVVHLILLSPLINTFLKKRK